jgi:hypothetical protein
VEPHVYPLVHVVDGVSVAQYESRFETAAEQSEQLAHA